MSWVTGCVQLAENGAGEILSGFNSRKLDFRISAPLPFNELPLVWLTAEVLKNVWERRSAGKPCRLPYIQACVIAECESMKDTNYADIVPIVELMIE